MSSSHLPKIIAVDGPAGSGKSSVSFAVAQQLGYLFVDTGAFYRAITLLALEQHADLKNPAELVTMIERTDLDMTPDLADDGRQCTFWADGSDITPRLHLPEVDQNVSTISAYPQVRAAVLHTQRALSAKGSVIMAGRDIGSVVLPGADLKIYIDASLDKRAERRYQQRVSHHEPADLDAIREGLRKRDEIDSNRSAAPLVQAEDAVYLNTDNLSLQESIEAVLYIIHEWQPRPNS